MKKFISLLLALAMYLSMCACGGSEKEMTKEEMMEAASDFDFSAFKKAISSNEAKAKETYAGGIYHISAFVEEITDNKCTLTFFIDPNTSDYRYYVSAPFDKDTLLALNTGDRINLVGRVKTVKDRTITLDTAYYIDNTTELSVKICSIMYASASDALPKYSTVIIQDFLDDQVVPYCNVYIDGEDLANLKEDDEIVVRGELAVLGDDFNVYMYYDKYVGLEMKNASIVK